MSGDEEKLIKLLIKFHKTIENWPIQAINVFNEIVESSKNLEDIRISEDCAEFLAEYIKNSSVWKQRAIGESLQSLPFTSRLLILNHFSNFLTPCLSIDFLMSDQRMEWFGFKIKTFRKSKMPFSAFVFGTNNCGKLGIGDKISMTPTLIPLDFEFNEAFHGQNHTIFWRRFTGEVWACGKSENFIKQHSNQHFFKNSYSTPIKLDYINLTDKKEQPIIKIGENYTVFENFTSERSFFIGNPKEKTNWMTLKNLEIWEQGSNWMIFTRNSKLSENEKTCLNLKFNSQFVKIECEKGCWKCEDLGAKGAIINYFCGKRIPKLTDLTICEDATAWYQDRETLYKGVVTLSEGPWGLQLIASLQEVSFLFRIGGFSVSPDGRSFIVYAKNRANHLEELHPRHQMDYSMFTQLTFDPWSTYFSDFQSSVKKLDATRNWLSDKYATCFNEYGFIQDELETLTALSHLYELIRIQPNQSLPDMMISLISWENDKLAQMLIVQDYRRKVLETENLRIRVPPGANLHERVIEKARKTYEHKITVIRAGLETLQKLHYPADHEGIWTYVKYIEFIGHYRNRSLGSKGRFETKSNMRPYFQTRDLKRIVRRRVDEGCFDDEEVVMRSLIKVQAIGHRSDKTKMDNFYIYPCIQYVFRTVIEAIDPNLLAHIDEDNSVDLNVVCHNDTDNTRFVRYIRELTGCEHPRDFGRYHRRISLERLLLAFPDTLTVQTSDSKLKIPQIIFQIFSSEPCEEDPSLRMFLIPDVTGNVFKLAIEALLDIRELLVLSAQEKFKIYRLYCDLLFMEAAADVIKMIVVTGEEEDVDVFRNIFQLHPLEISQCIAKYRPEILTLWSKFPVPTPQIANLEIITDLILSKRYTVVGVEKPLIMNLEAMFGLKMGEKWLKQFFTNGNEDGEVDMQRKFRDYIHEDDDVRDFSTA